MEYFKKPTPETHYLSTREVAELSLLRLRRISLEEALKRIAETPDRFAGLVSEALAPTETVRTPLPAEFVEALPLFTAAFQGTEGTAVQGEFVTAYLGYINRFESSRPLLALGRQTLVDTVLIGYNHAQLPETVAAPVISN